MEIFGKSEHFSGQVPTESLRTQDSEYLYEMGVETFFGSVLPPRSWEIRVERELPSKFGWCNDKLGEIIHFFRINPLERSF